MPPTTCPRRPPAVASLAAIVPALLGLLLCLTLSACQSEGDLGKRLEGALSSGGWSFAYLIALLAGIATSLTPCVYPLIPITVSLFGARDDEVSRVRALGLAACYVGGIAVMYTSLGLFCGLTGAKFGTFLTNPFVIIPIAVFFVAMAASMFGAFELALPVELQGRLSRVGGKGGRGAFQMGLVSGVIAAPCTGPPLLVLLGFVATQRSVVLGGSLLFVYAVGIGLLFFAIAGFSLKLPRSGPWMEAVKSVFGVVMILVALYFLRNVAAPLRAYGRPGLHLLGVDLSAWVKGPAGAWVRVHRVLALPGLVAVAGAALGAIHLSFHEGPMRSARKLTGVALLCLGLYGALSWYLTPRPLHWLADEPAAVQQARAAHRPMLIDFGADWCGPCQQLELRTFSDERVARELQRFVLLHVDCSKPSDRVDALQARYQAESLPTVLIYDGAGTEVKRIVDFIKPDDLLPVLQKVR